MCWIWFTERYGWNLYCSLVALKYLTVIFESLRYPRLWRE